MTEPPAVDAASVELVAVRRRFGAVAVLDGIDLSVGPGERVAVLGPSGCGKSTLLRIVAGIDAADAGTVHVDGAVPTGPHHSRAMLGQDDTLFPWLTAEENVAFGPRRLGLDRPRQRAAALLAEVGLADAGHLRPAQLSGGMRQRTALARVLAVSPSVVLLDEPFGALDAQTRLRMHAMLRDVLGGRGTTMLVVTHDVDEALLLADRVVVLSHRPAVVRTEVRVPLPRRRDHHSLLAPEAVAVKGRLLDLVLGDDAGGDRVRL